MSLPFDPKVQSALDQHELFLAKKMLGEIEQMLFYIIENAQTREEARPGFVSHFKHEETGEFICVPEDAAPWLDEARGYVNEALNSIDTALTHKEYDHES